MYWYILDLSSLLKDPALAGSCVLEHAQLLSSWPNLSLAYSHEIATNIAQGRYIIDQLISILDEL